MSDNVPTNPAVYIPGEESVMMALTLLRNAKNTPEDLTDDSRAGYILNIAELAVKELDNALQYMRRNAYGNLNIDWSLPISIHFTYEGIPYYLRTRLTEDDVIGTDKNNAEHVLFDKFNLEASKTVVLTVHVGE